MLALAMGLSDQTRSDRLLARAPPEQMPCSRSKRHVSSQLERTRAQLFLLPEFRRGVWELSAPVLTMVR